MEELYANLILHNKKLVLTWPKLQSLSQAQLGLLLLVFVFKHLPFIYRDRIVLSGFRVYPKAEICCQSVFVLVTFVCIINK